MMGRSHLLFGATTSTMLLLIIGVPANHTSPEFGVGLAIGAIASVLPDIDGGSDVTVRRMLGVGSQQSKRRIATSLKRLGKGNLAELFLLILAVIAWIASLILDLFASLVSHRGLTHWAITCLGLTAVLGTIPFLLDLSFILPNIAQIPFVLAAPFLAGYASHILCDMATRSGVPVFGPFVTRSYHILPKHLRLRTGSTAETIMVAVAAPLCVALIWATHFLATTS